MTICYTGSRDERLDKCNMYGASRCKMDKRNGEAKHGSNGKRIPHKTLRYFPLKPKLQRFYMPSKTASLMR